jgi:hypothetical protein
MPACVETHHGGAAHRRHSGCRLSPHCPSAMIGLLSRRRARSLQAMQRAAHSIAPAFQGVGVNLRGADVLASH